MLRSDLCDCNDAYIVVEGTIAVTNPDNNAYDAPFISYSSKINNTLKHCRIITEMNQIVVPM